MSYMFHAVASEICATISYLFPHSDAGICELNRRVRVKIPSRGLSSDNLTRITLLIDRVLMRFLLFLFYSVLSRRHRCCSTF